MSRTVVLPLHDSLFAPRVMLLLKELGRRSDIDIHVLGLSGESPIPAIRHADPESAADAIDATANRTAGACAALLLSVAQQLSDVLGSTRVRAEEREGEVAEVLADYARRQQAEMITVGIENRDAQGEELALRFAKDLVRESGSAVFLTATARRVTRGVFLADLDGTEAARARLELALTSATIAGVDELTVQDLSRGGRGDTTPRRPAPA